REKASLQGFLSGVDLLLHLASAHDHFSEADMRAVNIQGTEALLDEAKRNAKKGFQIWIVSSAVIGAPVYSYYRDSKRVQEKLIRGSGIPWASFRPTLVYGIGDHRHTAPWLRRCGARRGVDRCYELAGPTGIAYNGFVDLTIAAACGGVRRRNIPKRWADRFIF